MESSLCHTKQTQEIESKTMIWKEHWGDKWLHLPGMIINMDQSTGIVTIKSGGQYILPGSTSVTATLKNLTDETAEVLPQTEKETVLDARKLYQLTVCSVLIILGDDRKVILDTWTIDFTPNTN